MTLTPPWIVSHHTWYWWPSMDARLFSAEHLPAPPPLQHVVGVPLTTHPHSQQQLLVCCSACRVVFAFTYSGDANTLCNRCKRLSYFNDFPALPGFKGVCESAPSSVQVSNSWARVARKTAEPNEVEEDSTGPSSSTPTNCEPDDGHVPLFLRGAR
eukprot:2553551-Prymnesium_polylepis.1